MRLSPASLILFLVILALAGAPADAAPPQPASDPLRLLEGLTPEQRAAALEALRTKRRMRPAEPAPQQEVPDTRLPLPARSLPEEPSPIERAMRRAAALLLLGRTGPAGAWEEAADAPMAAEGEQRRETPGAVADAEGDTDARAPDAPPEREGRESRDSVDPGTLRQYGYELFAGVPSTFAPATDIPVPPDYVVGPGDTVQVQLFGKVNAEHSLVVTREGLLHFPEIGPVQVAGLTFREMRELLQRRIAEQMIGVRSAITMGPLRSIRVFVLGEARTPGSYTVSALATMTNALLASGGIRKIGSLRRVQLKRRGRIVTNLDLYDLLLRGDTRDDARLQPGDVIFVPPIGPVVGVAGEVRRPGIYELAGERTIGEVLGLAGGLLPTAHPPATRIVRVDGRGGLRVVDVDLGTKAAWRTPVRDGDLVHVASILERARDTVLLTGHVQRPGPRQWRPGMRVSDLIPSVEEDLLPEPDLDYVLVRREEGPTRTVRVFSVRLGEALRSPGSPADVPLRPRDRVHVFPARGEREDVVAPIVEELRAQARHGAPARVVRVSGLVRAPGEYPLEAGMRVSDLLRAGGGLSEAAYTLAAELTRHEVVDGRRREIEHIPVDLAGVLARRPDADLALRPHDVLHVKRVPRWAEGATVELRGEVRFPGRYPIARGERLSSVLRRAGGITGEAFPEGAVFMRESLREKEAEQLRRLSERLRAEIGAAQLARGAKEKETQMAVAVGKELAAQLEAVRPVGRLVVDLPRLLRDMAAGRPSEADVTLRDGDVIVIPPQTQEVTVIGEVFHPTSHVWRSGLGRDDYIRLSGGMTRKADRRNVYVVRANGAVIAGGGRFGSRWFDGVGQEIRPGDTIVVPLDIERIRPLTFWTNVSQIIYQIGVAAAAWKTVGVF